MVWSEKDISLKPVCDVKLDTQAQRKKLIFVPGSVWHFELVALEDLYSMIYKVGFF